MSAPTVNAKLCCNYMRMAVYIVSPLFDLFWVAVKTYLPLITRGTPFVSGGVLAEYLLQPGRAGISIADRNCLQPLAVRSDTIGGRAIPGWYNNASHVVG